MWVLKGMDETCAWAEEYNVYSTKKKAKEAFKEEIEDWKKEKAKSKIKNFNEFGYEGKVIYYPDGYWYALWIEESDEPEDKFELVDLNGNYCSYTATIYNPKRQYWKDLFFEGYTKKDVIYKLRNEDHVTVSREFC